jgi:superfamily II DNA or RNA helicase
MTAAVAPATPPIGGTAPPAYKLWQHQEDCIQFCLPKRGALIAAAMGTGKSLMVIELIKRRRHSLTLIIAPKAVAQNVWEGQLERLCDLTGENRSTITRNALWAYVPQELQSRLLALRGPDKMDSAPSEG